MEKFFAKISLKQLLTGAMGLLVIYFLPYFIFGENATILIHDNLDSNLVWAKLVIENGGVFSNPNTLIPQILGGVPRSSVFGTYDISLLWFSFFGMYWGYVVNKIIMGLVAFWGMFKLLSKYLNSGGLNNFILVGVSLMFAVLPFWSFTLSVAGMPAVLYAFLNLRSPHPSRLNWFIIGLMPWYSSLVLSGFFMVIILGLIWVFDGIRSKKVNGLFLAGLILFGCMYVLSHIPLFYSFVFQSGELSHRVEMKWNMVNWEATVDIIQSLFIEGQYHAHSLHSSLVYVILAMVGVAILTKRNVKTVVLILVFIVLSSVLYGLLRFEGLAEVVQKLMAVVPIQLQRFHFLHPMFWYFLLAIGLVSLTDKWVWGKFAVMGIIIFQLITVSTNHEVFSQENKPTYKQFFAVEQFDELKMKMDKPLAKNKVLSIGLHPSISQYNGCFSLDGYLPSYPLSYKHQFRKVIAGELEKDPVLKSYFDDWGSRCYAFSSEIGKDFIEPGREPVQDLDYDFSAFKDLGGKYIISSTEILNNKYLDLITISVSNDHYWSLYLYQVK